GLKYGGKKLVESALRESLSLDNGGRHKCSAGSWSYLALRCCNHRSNEAALSVDCLPTSNPSMPISSSRSGQCMPYPALLICTLARSAGVPCARRGYQPMGTAMVRPSSRSTDTVSSVTVTLTILGRVSVITAEGVPFM